VHQLLLLQLSMVLRAAAIVHGVLRMGPAEAVEVEVQTQPEGRARELLGERTAAVVVVVQIQVHLLVQALLAGRESLLLPTHRPSQMLPLLVG
jgi:hypothetical protein